MLLLSSVYLAVPADPISSTIQRLVFGIDSLNSQTFDSSTTNLASDNRLDELVSENQRLRQELNYKLSDNFEIVTGAVVSKSVQNYRSTIDISIGSSDGVEIGQPAMSQGQLIGRVSQVFDNRSRILTMTDPDFRAAALIDGTTSEGLVRHVAGGVIIEQVALDDQSKKTSGIRVVTSGLGGVFPPGLLIGIIGDDISPTGSIFKEFVLDNTIDLGTVSEVVVLKV